MTREFLKAIEGLTPEAIDKIMDENGNDITNAQKDYADVKAKLKTAEETLTTVKGELKTLTDAGASAEDYKAKFEKLEKQMADDEQARKDEQADKTLTDAITAVFPADKKFTSDYVRNGIIADMKAEIAKEENQGKGYAEIFTGLTTDKEGIFQSLHPAGQMTGINTGSANNTNESQLYKIMGITPPK